MSGKQYGIYIHTRNRIKFLDKSLPVWNEMTPKGIEIVLVVEPDEYDMHAAHLEMHEYPGRVSVLGIDKPNLGMGNSRNVAFEHALARGHRAMITSDDDCFPKASPVPLLGAAANGRFGVGCWFSIYELINKMPKGNGIQRFTGGGGFRTFAMNVEMLDELGGFPVEFKGQDDNEICRRGIANGWAWWVNTDVPFHSIAKIGDPGGMCDLPGYKGNEERKHKAHILTREAWPEYTTDPAGCFEKNGKCSYRTYWKKMMRDHGLL